MLLQKRKQEAMGVRVFYDSEVTELRIENGRCTAARFTSGGFDGEIRAKSVVVASGGFLANEEWMREAWGEAADNFVIRGTPFNPGTLLKDLIDKGAATIGDPTQCHAVDVDARAPKYEARGPCPARAAERIAGTDTHMHESSVFGLNTTSRCAPRASTVVCFSHLPPSLV